MNKDRRKALAALTPKAEALESLLGQVASLAEEIKDDLEGLRDEEQEYYDNMPESLQSGEKGDMAEAAISQMEEAISTLDEIISRGDDEARDIQTCIEEAGA